MFQLTEKSAVYKLLATALSECLASEGDKNSNLEKYSKLIHGLGYDLINVSLYENFSSQLLLHQNRVGKVSFWNFYTEKVLCFRC